MHINHKFTFNLLITSLLVFFSSIIVAASQLVTTDLTGCVADTQKETVPGGTSAGVLDSLRGVWRDAGFVIGKLDSETTIYVCNGISNPDVIETPEQEALDQSASVATIAIDASIVQTNNVFTRLASLREQASSSSTNSTSKPVSNQNDPANDKDESYGGGASADSSSLLDQRLNFFINGSGSFGDQEATKSSNGFDFDTIGTTLGTDFRLTNNLVMGTAFGYTDSHTDMSKGLGHVDADSYSLSIFGGYSLPNSFYLDGLARVGWNDYDGKSTFNTNTTSGIEEHANSDYSGNDYSVSLSAGYNYQIDAFSVSPFLRYDYIHNDVDGFQETGNASSLSFIDEQHIDSMRSSIGAEVNYVVNTPYAILIPMMRAEWQHEFMNDSRLLTSYQNNGGSKTQLKTDSPDRDFMNLGFGLSAGFQHGISGFFYYETMLANNLTSSHAFNGGIRMEF